MTQTRALVALGVLLVLSGLLAYIAEGTGSAGRAARTAAPEDPVQPQEHHAERGVTTPLGQPAEQAEGTDQTGPATAKEELPDAYFGDLEIIGHVRNREGTGLSGLRVECRPAGFEPSTNAQNARLSTSSRADGYFSFSRFPKAQVYHLRAIGPGQLGETHVEFQRAGDRQLIVVGRLSYERYEFSDPDGQPVNVRGQIRLAIGRVVATSSAPHPPAQYARLAAMGFDLRELPVNTHVSVYSGDTIFANDRSGTHVVQISGYEPVRLKMFRWPVSRWPEAKRVVLTPVAGGARTVRYGVVFPRDDRPASWNVMVNGQEVPGPPYLSVDVHETAKQLRHSVSARQPWFWAAPEAHFQVLVGGARIPSRKVRVESGYEIQPEYTDFAVVTLIYPVPEVGGDKRFSVHIQAEHGGRYYRAWSARPGEARFRALPVGEYRFRRVWFSGTAGRFLSDTFGPVKLLPGHNALEWK